jgi:hypothetical protein
MATQGATAVTGLVCVPPVERDQRADVDIGHTVARSCRIFVRIR